MIGRIEALEREVQQLREQLGAVRLTLAEAIAAVKALTSPDPPLDDEAAVRAALQKGMYYVLGADVPGDVAEFGTMSGTTAVALASALRAYDHLQDIHASSGAPPRRKALHLFDSFQGLPPAESAVDGRSPHVVSGVWAAGTHRGLSPAELVERCTFYIGADRTHVHAGWFRDTLLQLPADTRFCLVHIDSDLYQSAREVLDHCFGHEMIERGAAIFFDDWSCNGADPSLGERRAWAEAVAVFDIRASDCGEYGMGARKFIVHGYTPRPPSTA
jgi:hypothetical protein